MDKESFLSTSSNVKLNNISEKIWCKTEEIFIQTILNKVALAVFALVVGLFVVDYPLLGMIPMISLIIVSNAISKLEKRMAVDKKTKTIGWICFAVTVIIGLVLILSFPAYFQ
ncbi:hypothetical protein [Atopococcus tabaci]|uniref:hypothetical protein n=1 Tax=Atopococcus tabaci TaxID=269774 RepID=UPI0004809337|nr:hypothetical protein [Atopococcus tabaci]